MTAILEARPIPGADRGREMTMLIGIFIALLVMTLVDELLGD